MKQLEMLYEGKAKQVFRTDDPDKIIIHYKDAATAFNNIKKATIEGKGVLNNAISTTDFQGAAEGRRQDPLHRDDQRPRPGLPPGDDHSAGGDRAQRHRRFDGPAPRHRGGHAALERHFRHLLQEGRAGRPADQRPSRRGAGRRYVRGAERDVRHDGQDQRGAQRSCS